MRKSTGVATPGPVASAVLEVRDPADQRCVVAEVPAMHADDVATAYQRAHAGFAVWRRANPFGRAVLSAAAGLIRSKAEDGAVTLVRENGKTLAEARVEVAKTASLRLANEFIDRAEAGQVAVNLPTSGWDVHHPFGGFRDSGSAFKEPDAPGLRFYTRLKTAAARFAW